MNPSDFNARPLFFKTSICEIQKERGSFFHVSSSSLLSKRSANLKNLFAKSVLFLLAFFFLSSWPHTAFAYEDADFEHWNELNHYSSELLMTQEEIDAYNQKILDSSSSMTNLLTLPSSIGKKDLKSQIQKLSSITTSVVDSKGNKLKEASLQKNLNLAALKNSNPITYAVTVSRTTLRSFPTWEKALPHKDSSQDLFTETAVYPWEAVALLHPSADGQWYFAKIRTYTGWIPAADVAFCSKADLKKWTVDTPFVLVIAPKVHLEQLQWDMGTRIPLMKETHQQYEVLLPEREVHGNLRTKTVFWKKTGDFVSGYLPYTQANLIHQALKFQSESYGWGGNGGNRDCSALIADAHRCFGIFLPRNTSNQGKEAPGESFDLSSRKGYSKRAAFMKTLPPGTVVYMPGHTMLYLGVNAKGNPVFIHQFAGYYDAAGKYISVMGCHITGGDLRTSKGISFLEACYGAKAFWEE